MSTYLAWKVQGALALEERDFMMSQDHLLASTLLASPSTPPQDYCSKGHVTLCDTMAPSRTPSLKSFTKSSLSVKSPEMSYEKKFLVVQHLLGKTTARNIAKRLKRDDSESTSASWRHNTCKTLERNIFSLATAGKTVTTRHVLRWLGILLVKTNVLSVVVMAFRKEVSHRKKRKMAKKLARDAEKRLEKVNSIKSRYSGANDGRPSEAPEVIKID
ncbi:hypothetical protein EV421DRAFT_1745835 [Armillaria borealis]|uniref:Uncharacterized protein n=1 Tax=Armillaria borealis TaxID=47425 RepID=A0AA39IEQ9_9AGAR|nr:hypothetical protein EV421DRAFT_1745835 [Armillaria borealis]